MVALGSVGDVEAAQPEVKFNLAENLVEPHRDFVHTGKTTPASSIKRRLRRQGVVALGSMPGDEMPGEL
eukprot:6140125-Pyramimonas_sp.AAC.1